MSPSPTTLIDRAQDRAVTRRPGFRSRERFNFGGHRRRGGEPFGALVVFNEDDSLGNDLIVGPDQVKVMHTGYGLHHGGTCLDGTRFLQIWLAADPTADSSPRVDVVTPEPSGRRDRWQTVAGPTPGEQVVGLRQAAWLFRGAFTAQRDRRPSRTRRLAGHRLRARRGRHPRRNPGGRASDCGLGSRRRRAAGRRPHRRPPVAVQRAPDRRACRPARPVRDEHERRDPAGVRRLPGGSARTGATLRLMQQAF